MYERQILSLAEKIDELNVESIIINQIVEKG